MNRGRFSKSRQNVYTSSTGRLIVIVFVTCMDILLRGAVIARAAGKTATATVVASGEEVAGFGPPIDAAHGIHSANVRALTFVLAVGPVLVRDGDRELHSERTQVVVGVRVA